MNQRELRWAIWGAVATFAMAASVAGGQVPITQPKLPPNLQIRPPSTPELFIRLKPEGVQLASQKKSRSWTIETGGGFEPITFSISVADSRIGSPNALGTSYFELVKPSTSTSNPITSTGTAATAPTIPQPTLPASANLPGAAIAVAPKPAAPQTRIVRFTGMPEFAVGTAGLPLLAVQVLAVDATGRKAVVLFNVQVTFATVAPALQSLSLQGAAAGPIVTTLSASETREYALDLSSWDSRDNPDIIRQTTSKIELEYPNGLKYQGFAGLRFNGQVGAPTDHCPVPNPCRARIPDLGLGANVKVSLVNHYGRSQPITVTLQRPIIEIVETENISLPSSSTNTTTTTTAGPAVLSSMPSNAGTCPTDNFLWEEIVVQDPSGRARLLSGGQKGTPVRANDLPRFEFKPGPSNTTLQVTYRMRRQSPTCPALVIN